MSIVFPEALIVAVLSIFLFLALCAALLLVTVSVRRPANAPLGAAVVLVVLCVLVVAISPYGIPAVAGLIVALLGTALAVLGGNVLARRVLDIATHGTVREGAAGGILVERTPEDGEGRVEEVLRGGTTIGYLERLAVVLAIVAGYPEAVAVVVALKGIGRFSELATPAARERFIVGTLASLVWASMVGALVRLAIW